jgi:hypothetical protein
MSEDNNKWAWGDEGKPNEPTRHSVDRHLCCGYDGYMKPFESGDWVRYDDYRLLKQEVERLQNNCDYLDQKLDEEIDKCARLAGHISKLLAHQEWQPISTYKGGNWAYLFVPLDNIPGNYTIVEACYMVGLQKWWVRSWKGTDRDAKINPTHWMPLFLPPEVGQ